MVKLKKKIRRREILLFALEEYASSTLYLMIANILYGFSFYLVYVHVGFNEPSLFMFIVLLFTVSYAVIVFQARIWGALKYFIEYSRYKYVLPAYLVRLGYFWSPILLFIGGLTSLFTRIWYYIVLFAYGLVLAGIIGLALHSFRLYQESRLKIFEWSAIFMIISISSYAYNILLWPPIAGVGLILLYLGLLRYKENIIESRMKI